jgi:glycosyltransferase involved in cell wall biosynthesis
MRILQVNKYFYLRGGSERYFFNVSDLLRRKGHEVYHFSMTHPRNEPSAQAEYFVDHVDLNAPMNLGDRVGAGLRILYSAEAKRRMQRLIDDVKPDVIHLHNITRQLSPSILDAARNRGVPSVQTMHDVSLVCPAHSFFVNGGPCEACAGGSYYHAASKRCIDGRVSSSVLGAFEAYLHSWLGLYRKISTLIAPSEAIGEKVSTLGWAKDKVVHLPYFIPLGPDYTSENEGYVLYSGRIAREKGLGMVLDAAAELEGVRFVVAGEGEDLEHFKAAARERGISNIEFLGYARGDELEGLLRGAACVVVPSIWFENLPLTILEAFARGKPVVGSDSGGIPEMVKHGETGYVAGRGDTGAFIEAIRLILSDEKRRRKLAGQARDLAGREYSPESHYGRLMSIYEDVTR